MRFSFAITLTLGLFTAAEVHASYIAISPPINAGRWGNQSPTSHASYISDAQYSVDVLIPLDESTVQTVRWRTYTHHYYDDGYYGYVRYRGELDCGGVDGGEIVIIDVRNRHHQKVGVMSYAHLDDVQVEQGDTFPWYSQPVLGYTKRWENSSCWWVNADNATHVHVEWGAEAPYNATQYGYDDYSTIGFSMGSLTK